jgi:CBS domain-containing protein
MLASCPHCHQKTKISSAVMSLNDHFARIPVTCFAAPTKGHVIIIPSTSKILEAVRILSHHNIHSAPVRDVAAPEDAPWSRKYLGFIDVVGPAFLPFSSRPEVSR